MTYSDAKLKAAGQASVVNGKRLLDDAEWLDGAFSAADILMVTVLRRLESSTLLDTSPSLCAYIARGKARPAYQRAFDAQLAVFKAASAS